MTTYSKASLKTFFENGDVPTGQNYSDLIDSQVNLVETASQQMAGALEPTELITARVSATNGVFTGSLRVEGQASASNIVATSSLSTHDITTDNFLATANVSAGGNLYGTNAVVTDVSATGTVYASAMRSTNGVINGVGVVSAFGTAQGTAASLVNIVNRGKGIVDGSTTGFTPLANRAGLVQYLFNEGASANLWPPTGGTINGLAANAAFPLAASAMVTIVHLTASAYAVK